MLTFRVSGKLWGESLVMNDIESGSEWSHLQGKCNAGKYQGRQLKIIPSVITTWNAWKTDHPGTDVSVLPRTAIHFKDEMYAMNPDRWVVGLRTENSTVAYPLEMLVDQQVLFDEVDGQKVLVIYDRTSTSAMIVSCELDGKTIDFTLEDGQLRAGGSQWSLTTASAIDGPLEGKRLSPLPAILSFTEAWMRFHPDTRVFGGAR